MEDLTCKINKFKDTTYVFRSGILAQSWSETGIFVRFKNRENRESLKFFKVLCCVQNSMTNIGNGKNYSIFDLTLFQMGGYFYPPKQTFPNI